MIVFNLKDNYDILLKITVPDVAYLKYYAFRNTTKHELWRGCTSICATISLGGKWILTK
jgi:hypothetical protein